MNSPFLFGATVFTTLAAITISRFVIQGARVKIIKSPAVTLLPKLTPAEIEALPYPPDALPGGRDVNSPVRLDLFLIGIILIS
jgi:hypothetical protein